MKKLLSLTVLFAALSFMACNNEKKGDKADAKTEEPQKVEDPSKPAESQTAVVKIHSCGADCKDGNHVYVHNEVGHTCTDVCGTAHACGAKCKDGQHEYAHGESGHTCTDDCTKS